MTVYHKFLYNCMLNNYELGDITDEEAFAQGYKQLNPEAPKDGKMYAAKKITENGNYLNVEWVEIKEYEESGEESS